MNKQIIYKNKEVTFYANTNFEEYEGMTKPHIKLLLGIEINTPSWSNMEKSFKAEDGFCLICDKLLKELKSLINNYKETTIKIVDDLGDTDAYVNFFCEKDKIVVDLQLGSTFEPPYIQYKFEADLSLLINLYNYINDNKNN